MNVFPAGSRVSFFDSNGQLLTGVVQSTSRLSDVSTQLVLIKRDSGATVTLPAASVFTINA
ncbi:hypothetical protein EV421DRAFT_1836697 [Armillaria borealis]|uniref:Uncharacterized protein n=1 Tax=Armillaria borealis TaxID=47425 RepID=A0AA39J3C3_9AGAR|nr:hypothetical protein EV421DRAFT_1836697 [Armillaria borealis]